MLWHSNAPWSPTGYGNQTSLFAPGIAEHYDFTLSSFYGLDGSRLNWQGIVVYPGLGIDFGNEYLVDHAKRAFGGDPRGGLVFTLMDVWVLNPRMVAQLDAVCWCPVDHEPLPGRIAQFFANSDAVPVAMSRFGETQLREAGLDPLYVPHGVDVAQYAPRDRREARKITGIPQDAFLVGMVAANKGRDPSRKGFQQALQAFGLFRAKHPDAILYLHSVVDPTHGQGEDIMGLINGLGIPEDAVRLADQYHLMYDPYSAKVMSHIYSAMDVLLHPAMGEGFGIPILEAAACGVPAVVTNFSAMPEVAGDAGWLVGCRGWWTGQQAWQALADVDECVAALGVCYGMSKAEKRYRSELARKHALNYSHMAVLDEFMLPALKQAGERIGLRRPVELEAVAA